jgi:hypothetical protein
MHEGALGIIDFLPLLGDRQVIVLGQGYHADANRISQPCRKCVAWIGQTRFSRALQHYGIDRALLDNNFVCCGEPFLDCGHLRQTE